MESLLLLLCLSFLVTMLCLLFGFVLGLKLSELFDSPYAGLLGPASALALGLAFGVRDLGFFWGLAAGLIGAAGSAYVLFRR